MDFTNTLLFVVIVVLTSAVSSSLQTSCREVHQPPHKTLKLLRRNYRFVEKSFPSSKSSLEIPLRRVGRDVSATILGNSRCPWTWGQDDNPDRVPRHLLKAVCPICETRDYCKKVLYSHGGLVQSSRCDVKTGEKVWKWTQVELPVAFVYDP